MNKSARKHSSPLLKELLSKVTSVEKLQTSTKMTLAVRLDDLIQEKGWNKSEFAEKVNKNPSEITKWLSGTQNFTVDTLSEIALAFNVSIDELFAPRKTQVINRIQFVIVAPQASPRIPFLTPISNSYSTPIALQGVSKDLLRSIQTFNTKQFV